MKTISPGRDERYLGQAIALFKKALNPLALTGAGISVGSGIPDFRSADGLWSLFSPDEYATLEVFFSNPGKAWQLYRAMGEILLDKEPNPAHLALAELEKRGQLRGVITQNVDNLHQMAGSTKVLEIHGDHSHLQCIKCGRLAPVGKQHYQAERVPLCEDCQFPLKPNVVLFGEAVRRLEEIHALIAGCDLLMVIGTSAQVFPAAEFPFIVKRQGGLLFEFNQEQTLLSLGTSHAPPQADYLILGDVFETLPLFVKEIGQGRATHS